MTVREMHWPLNGAAVRWIRGMLVTLCAVLAVLLHHELPAAPTTAAPAAAVHAISGPASTTAAHTTHAGSAGPGSAAHGTDGAACPSMAMQLCSAAGVTAVQLAAPSESPNPAVPTHCTTIAGVDIAGSTNRAPPDLSVLSQLRL
ncbi:MULTISPECIES: DUF6153 family protein [unclassified Streptomyces]|uniref:DUF6153 family protein n=1 Tax=unclassified Streptomyces TaxID=2593676 RepID=UPI002365718E|nr:MULTISPECIES: DUF6153 family protein [unclassified Streptomyces]MDF3142089.1 DUF6153 family protein [Streptomyces sp. T21Q-yed]WDF43043.1 DUF6153 family protein [Streptomyces sp. T12]